MHCRHDEREETHFYNLLLHRLGPGGLVDQSSGPLLAWPSLVVLPNRVLPFEEFQPLSLAIKSQHPAGKVVAPELVHFPVVITKTKPWMECFHARAKFLVNLPPNLGENIKMLTFVMHFLPD